MDIITKINSRFRSIVQNGLNGYDYTGFQDIMSGSSFQGCEKFFERSLKPYFISENKRNDFDKITGAFVSMLEKMTHTYFNNNYVKEILHVRGRVSEYLNNPPGYTGSNLVVRLDVFYDQQNENFKLLEINCDNPSGMGINGIINGIFDRLPSMKVLSKEFILRTDTLIDSFCDMLLNKYKEFCLSSGKPLNTEPYIAVACSRNSSIRYDVELIINLLKAKNLNAVFADPRDFVYDGKVLKVQGKAVDIIYRDTVSDFFRAESKGKPHSFIRNKILNFSNYVCLHNSMINHLLKTGYFGHAEDVLQAYVDNNVCLINPFTSNICANKSTLALLYDDGFRELLSEEEIDVVDRFVPWTKVIKNVNTVYDNDEINLVPFIKENRRSFVIKPAKGFGGKNVTIGQDVSQIAWENLISKILTGNGNYVVQQYMDAPSEEFPVYVNGKLHGFSKQNMNLNLWGIDGKFAGAFVRASEDKIINVSRGGRDVPVYYVLN